MAWEECDGLTEAVNKSKVMTAANRGREFVAVQSWGGIRSAHLTIDNWLQGQGQSGLEVYSVTSQT